MAEKQRTDDDWRELGEHIYHARKGLADAWVKSSQIFGNRDPHTREVKKLYESLGGLMVELDSRYSHDGAKWTFGNPSPIFGAGNSVPHSETSAHQSFES